MSTRHRARQTAFQILYAMDASREQAGQVDWPTGARLATEINRHFEHFKVAEPSRSYCADLVSGVLSELAAIDALITQHAKNWKLERLTVVDRNILRLATHELRKKGGEPAPAVVIDEAVELAKEFGSAESAAFINGILDTIRKAGEPA